ncbi:M16 family metallopeptidase [Chenggangzhangella methanolivorans]|uniref:Insulinase family protein n=1 Tax=Chenggangzhangella methanolivorans TaxID=1437009 RepID=A0A9E6ULC1_9HYPH|nr:pitrilysin family protein [Chenggangzhangella methanolivorans]QZN98770.1 insulinase family protein [Chenggangzhangella methanolivorans]
MSPRLTVLPSGVAVITDAMPELGTAAVGVTFGAGARSETEKEHGLAHFLEHMAFKGTARRSARQIAEEIEQVGGDLNAATGVEQTGYSARVLAADVGLALDMLADIVIEPSFDPTEIKREQNVVVQEIGGVEDTPDDLVFDWLQETAFPNQTLGRSILGTPKSVRGLDRDLLSGFRDRCYRAKDTVVTAAGAVDHEAVVAEAEKRFAGLPAGEAPKPALAAYVGGDRRAKRDYEQLHVTIAFEGRAFDAEDVYAAQVFANLAGGGMSSRLFQEVREERGLAYSVNAFHWSYADSGLFGAYAALGPEDAADILPVMIDVLLQAAETADEREVERAKAQMKAGLLMSLEQPASRADHHARHQLAFGRPLDVAETVQKIEAVTVAAVRESGRALMTSAPTLAAVGPIRRLTPPERLAERLGRRASAA